MDSSAAAYSGRDHADLDDGGIVASIGGAKSEWPAPDWSILKANRRPALPMPTGLFGPALALLEAIAEGTATPLDYPAAAYLATCASLIGGKRRVRPYATSDWREPPILWIGIVGDPSSRKSPPLDAVIDPLRAIESDGAELHKVAIREWREADRKAKAVRDDWETRLGKAVKSGAATMPAMPTAAIEPDEPARRRTLVMDATPEAIGAILAGNPQGTLHYRDELAGWLQSFERYSPGGREQWLEAYGGRSFVIDRKGAKGPLAVPFNGVSVLGGIQPAKMADCLLASPDDGLVARFLWIWPDKLKFTRPRQCADLAKLESTYRRLEALEWGRNGDGKLVAITLPLSGSAADLFEAWQTENAEFDDDASGLLKSFVGKMDGALLRLALTAELARWAMTGGPEPREISLETIEAASDWVDSYAKPMAERVYGDAALPIAERDAAVLARYIVKKGLRAFNKRELKRSPHKSALPSLRNAKAMDAALEVLEDGGLVRTSGKRDGEGPGRASGDYAVNPALHRAAQ
jgi:hypothetical protein